MLKKKIGIFITSNEYLRNFVNSGIINKLSKNLEIHIFINKNIKIDKRKIKNCKSIRNYKNSHNNSNHQYWNLIKLWKYRDKAKSFKARVLEYYRIDFKRFKFDKQKNFYFLFLTLYSTLSFIKDILRFVILNILSYEIFFKLYKKFYVNNLSINSSLVDCVEKKKIDLIVNPTSAHNVETIDLIKIGKKKNIKTLLIIDNWDNLSSKIAFDEKPDHIFCWGQQSIVHANKIHNIRKNIKPIGSARFDAYFEKRKLLKKDAHKKKNILFLGSSLEWNEKEALHILDDLINKNKKIYNNLKIIYRPHPKLNWRKWYYKENYKNVLIDKQIVNTRYRDWPDLDYYPSLLSNCFFIVGGLTSMIIESTIFYKNYLAIAYDDKNFLWNQKYVLETRPHLREVKNLKNVHFCNRKKELAIKFHKLFVNTKYPSNKFKSIIDNKRNFFLYNDDLQFHKRLEINIKEIFKNEENNKFN